MRILLSSYAFAPAVGGIETISLVLAQGWSALGHEVTVVTETVEETGESFAFEVVRRPDFRALRRLIASHDIYFQNNVSLQLLWAWAGTRKPLFIAHQTWLYSDTRAEALRTRLKRFFIARATSVSISKSIADAIAPGSILIPNAYDDQIFRVHPDVARERDLVFVGRLVPDKGVDVLLRALHLLKTRGLTPNLTIIGDGPDAQTLRGLGTALELKAQVEFAGVLRGEELAKRIGAHRILVVPSIWNEPFGIVALEGIACGCAVVGSSGGGLPDAIGPCGATFPNGDSEALAGVLMPLLRDPALWKPFLEAAPAHLEKHRAENVARAYLEVFEAKSR